MDITTYNSKHTQWLIKQEERLIFSLLFTSVSESSETQVNLLASRVNLLFEQSITNVPPPASYVRSIALLKQVKYEGQLPEQVDKMFSTNPELVSYVTNNVKTFFASERNIPTSLKQKIAFIGPLRFLAVIMLSMFEQQLSFLDSSEKRVKSLVKQWSIISLKSLLSKRRLLTLDVLSNYLLFITNLLSLPKLIDTYYKCYEMSKIHYLEELYTNKDAKTYNSVRESELSVVELYKSIKPFFSFCFFSKYPLYLQKQLSDKDNQVNVSAAILVASKTAPTLSNSILAQYLHLSFIESAERPQLQEVIEELFGKEIAQ